MAVSVSLPVASAPAATLIVAEPLTRAAGVELYAPLVSVTTPVTGGAPLPPLTDTSTETACAGVKLPSAGVTVTVGVTLVTVTEPLPDALVYVEVLAESGVYEAVSESVPAPSAAAAIWIVALPPASVVAAEV